MKLRTSSFNKTVLKKDLTRFFPLWALYLIGGLLVMHVLSGFYDGYYNSRTYSIARDLNDIIGPMGVFSAGYGFLAAQLLFGDLHNTRLCYGVHAFPLRRESIYLTHVLSGLLMGLAPTLVIALTIMPVMGQFAFTALLCFCALALHYLFFFALSVVCMMCTGNRFAATAVYGIVNFLSLIVRWFVQLIYLPLLHGVRANIALFNQFCPMVGLSGRNEFFNIEHLDTCQLCHLQNKSPGYYIDVDGGVHEYAFLGLGSDWGYLLILAAVGIALLGAGLMLYRVRHLERAGDFMAFKPMKPIFLTVYTLCVGCLMFYFAYEIGDTFAGFIFLVIGIFIGWFTGQMLLERTIRVFKGKNFGHLGILYAAVALSLLLTWVDPAGISRRIPKAEKVETVYLYNGHLSDYQLGRPDRISGYSETLVITDPQEIAALCESHRLMIQEHDESNTDHYRRWITLQYRLKNGTTVSRSYYIDASGDAWDSVKPFLTKPNYLFAVDTLQQLQEKTTYIFLSEFGEISQHLYPQLLEALWLDAQEGYLYTGGTVYEGKHTMYVELRLKNQYRALYFTENAPHLKQWMDEYQTSPEMLLRADSLNALQANIQHIYFYDYDLQFNFSNTYQVLELLWEDCKIGKVSGTGKEGYQIYLTLECKNCAFDLTLSADSSTAAFVKSLAAPNK